MLYTKTFKLYKERVFFIHKIYFIVRFFFHIIKYIISCREQTNRAASSMPDSMRCITFKSASSSNARFLFRIPRKDHNTAIIYLIESHKFSA